jgi:ABC-2 type transport system permease protein
MLYYLRVFLTFARNSLVRDMTFRANFAIDAISSTAWVLMNLAFYVLVFRYAPAIGADSGWEKYPFFVFLATGLLINSLVHALFMTNADDLSELVRTGSLDFALLKPIDTQFLVSCTRIEWSALGNFVIGLVLLGYALWQMGSMPSLASSALYSVYVACGVAIYYSLMIAMAATSVWLGRNQTLFDFWFYITNFSRYPMEIYRGPWGTPLRVAFTFFIPVLVAVNVPARIMARPVNPKTFSDWVLPAFAIAATLVSLAGSRWVFQRAMQGYRSASS